MKRLLLCTAVAALPALVNADDAALVFGNERYETLGTIAGADNSVSAAQNLQSLGFKIFSLENARALSAKDQLAGFQSELENGAERAVVILAGRFVTDGDRTWFLYSDAEQPDLFTVEEKALSIESVLAVLSAYQGNAVLLMGEVASARTRIQGSYLRSGIGPIDAPQGVTVLSGGVNTISAFVEDRLSTPKGDLGQMVRNTRGLRSLGFLPQSWVMMPTEVAVETVDPTPGPSEEELNAEAAMWDNATATDSVEAYRAYIRRFPNGRFVQTAEEKINAILSEPNRDARIAEEALSLNRAARRQIQSDLTVMGYNTRGVDGIFGPGTRRAVSNWQQSNGYPQTSYVTQEQINRLSAQAERRRAEIAAEEQRQRDEAERLDREYWSETGGKGDEPGYRAYLNRYPEGLFAEVAKQRLALIEQERQQSAEIADRSAWGQAAAQDTVAAYQEYLTLYPQGVFAQEARSRIEAMQAPSVSDSAVASARAHEEALRLSGVRAQLLELRLRDLGYTPRPLDGVIDQRTRDALAQFQDQSGIAPTGYVDQSTLLQLMAGSGDR